MVHYYLVHLLFILNFRCVKPMRIVKIENHLVDISSFLANFIFKLKLYKIDLIQVKSLFFKRPAIMSRTNFII